MSNQTNDLLYERALNIAQLYEGTDLELAITNLIEKNDLEKLEYLVKEAEDSVEDFEFRNDPMTDERAEAMFVEREDSDVY